MELPTLLKSKEELVNLCDAATDTAKSKELTARLPPTQYWPQSILELKPILDTLPLKNLTYVEELWAAPSRHSSSVGEQIIEGWKIHLGEAGRAKIKRLISEQFILHPSLKDKGNNVCKLKSATLEQLVLIADVVGLLPQVLKVAKEYDMKRAYSQENLSAKLKKQNDFRGEKATVENASLQNSSSQRERRSFKRIRVKAQPSESANNEETLNSNKSHEPSFCNSWEVAQNSQLRNNIKEEQQSPQILLEADTSAFCSRSEAKQTPVAKIETSSNKDIYDTPRKTRNKRKIKKAIKSPAVENVRCERYVCGAAQLGEAESDESLQSEPTEQTESQAIDQMLLNPWYQKLACPLDCTNNVLNRLTADCATRAWDEAEMNIDNCEFDYTTNCKKGKGMAGSVVGLDSIDPSQMTKEACRISDDNGKIEADELINQIQFLKIKNKIQVIGMEKHHGKILSSILLFWHKFAEFTSRVDHMLHCLTADKSTALSSLNGDKLEFIREMLDLQATMGEDFEGITNLLQKDIDEIQQDSPFYRSEMQTLPRRKDVNIWICERSHHIEEDAANLACAEDKFGAENAELLGGIS